MPISIKRVEPVEAPIEKIETHPIGFSELKKAFITILIDRGDDADSLYPARIELSASCTGVSGYDITNAAELRQIAEAATLAADELDRSKD